MEVEQEYQARHGMPMFTRIFYSSRTHRQRRNVLDAALCALKATRRSRRYVIVLRPDGEFRLRFVPRPPPPPANDEDDDVVNENIDDDIVDNVVIDDAANNVVIDDASNNVVVDDADAANNVGVDAEAVVQDAVGQVLNATGSPVTEQVSSPQRPAPAEGSSRAAHDWHWSPPSSPVVDHHIRSHQSWRADVPPATSQHPASSQHPTTQVSQHSSPAARDQHWSPPSPSSSPVVDHHFFSHESWRADVPPATSQHPGTVCTTCQQLMSATMPSSSTTLPHATPPLRATAQPQPDLPETVLELAQLEQEVSAELNSLNDAMEQMEEDIMREANDYLQGHSIRLFQAFHSIIQTLQSKGPADLFPSTDLLASLPAEFANDQNMKDQLVETLNCLVVPPFQVRRLGETGSFFMDYKYHPRYNNEPDFRYLRRTCKRKRNYYNTRTTYEERAKRLAAILAKKDLIQGPQDQPANPGPQQDQPANPGPQQDQPANQHH